MADPAITLPDEFVQNNKKAFGPAADAWLKTLPALLVDLARRWDLTLGPPYTLSFNYVAPARRADGSAAVLKVGVPDPAGERRQELLALRRYAGDGICRLLAEDEGNAALLLEQVFPGDTLVGLARANDDAATRIAARLMRRLWRPARVAEGFASVADWLQRAFARHRVEYGGAGPFPSALFRRAESLGADLIAARTTPTLLHGDLHHYNILTAEREPWLAIDPKGVVGDPAFDVGQFLLNPNAERTEALPALACRRLAIFAEELGEDRQRLRDWALVENVLSACWSAEDGATGWHTAIAVAEAVAAC